MFLKDWGCSRTYDALEELDRFTNLKVYIRYWVYTEAEMNEQLESSEDAAHVEKREYLTNDDGDEIICQTCDFNGAAGNIKIAYEYYKK